MRTASSARLPTNLILVGVGGITALAIALRLSSFGASLFGDEVSSYGIVSGHGPGTIVDLVRSDLENSPPLFYLLAGAGERLAGAPEGLRLPSFIAGVAAVPLTYLLGAWTVGTRAALAGAALVAVSPILIFYSGLGRGYSLAMLLGLLSTLALLRALERRAWGWWAAYAAFAAAALYTHYTVVFVLIAQFAWAFFAHPDSRRALLAASAAAAALFLPWLPGLREDSGSPTYLYDLLNPLDLEVARETLVSWAVGHPVLETDLIGAAGLALVAAGFALGAAGLVLDRRGNAGSWRPSRDTTLVIALALALPVGAGVYSLLGSEIFTARNLIPSWPGLALALGALLTAGRASLAIPALALCLGGIGIGTVKMQDADNRHPDYQAVAEFIDESGPAASPIAELTPSGWGPQTALEAALGDPHEARPGGHPVLQLSAVGGQGWPSVAERHRYMHSKETVLVWSPLTRHRSSPEQAVRVARLAQDDTFFFVGFEQIPSAFGLLPGGPPGDFTEALPPGYRVVETRDFPGFNDYAPRVYVFRRG